MTDEKLSDEAQFWSADCDSFESQPKLDRAMPLFPNYVPVKYKRFDDDDLGDLSASNDTSSLTGIPENQTSKNRNLEAKPCSHTEKTIVNYLPSILIDVANLSPERARSAKKAVHFADDKTSSETKMVVSTEESLGLKHSSLKAENRSANTITPVFNKVRGRPNRRCTESAVSQNNDKAPQSYKRRRTTSPASYIISKRKVFAAKRATQISPQSKDIGNNPEIEGMLLRSVSKDTSPNEKVTTAGTNDVERQHQCNICHKVYSDLFRLQNHIHWHVKKKMFRCSICRKIFKGFGHFIRHQQLHSKSKKSQQEKIPHGNTRVPNGNTRTEKTQKGQQKLGNKCSICSRTFSSLGRLRLHQVVHQKKNRKIFRCQVCSKEFVYFGRIKKHALKFHNITKLNRCQVKIPKPKYPSCSGCEKTFNSEHDLQIHYRLEHDGRYVSNAFNNSEDIIDDGKGIYKCGTCKKNFSMRRTLHVHKRLHTGERPFRCHVCCKRFLWRTQLLGHCKSVHDKCRPYKCNKCGSLFETSLPMKRHKCVPKLSSCAESKDKQGNDDGLYECRHCDRVFASFHGLRLHNAKTHKKHKSAIIKVCRSPLLAQRCNMKDVPSHSLGTRSKAAKLNSSLLSQSRDQEACRSPRKWQEASSFGLNLPEHTTSQRFSSKAKQKTRKEEAYATKEQNHPETVASPRRDWILILTDNGQQVYRCGLCTHSDRNFGAVSSVRKHVGMVHSDFRGDLVEPPGLYDNGSPEQASTSPRPSTNSTLQEPNLTTCTCRGRGRAFVYKNNQLTHLPSDCLVHKTEKQAKDEQVLKCKHCDEEFEWSSQEKFKEHELSHELEATEPMGMMYACFECGEEFALANDLMDHHSAAH